MSDLISRSALFSRIEREYRKWGEDYDAEQILGDIEDFPTAFDVDKVIAELEDLDIHFDNDYSSGNKEPMLMKQEILGLLKKHLSATAEPSKTD